MERGSCSILFWCRCNWAHVLRYFCREGWGDLQRERDRWDEAWPWGKAAAPSRYSESLSPLKVQSGSRRQDGVEQPQGQFVSQDAYVSLKYVNQNCMKSVQTCVLFPSGPEGALFQHSVEVPLLKSELLKDLRWECSHLVGMNDTDRLMKLYFISLWCFPSGWSLLLAPSVWTPQKEFISKPWPATLKLPPTWMLFCTQV